MIGAILAGGFGKRLRPVANNIPKALITIKDEYTIMDRQLLDFSGVGIKDVYVLSGHLGEKIEERYGKESRGIRMHYLKEEKPMGTLYSVRNLISTFGEEDIILRNGDTVTDVNLKKFIEFSRASQYGLVIFAIKMRSPFGIVDLLGDQVGSFKEKPLLNYYMNAGLYYIKKSIFDVFLREYLEKDIERTAFPELAAAKLIGAYKEDTFWIGVDSEKEMEQVREEYKNRTDYTWGYKKTIVDDKNFEISDYFIKSEETVEFHLGDNDIFKVVYGSGVLINQDHRVLKENEITYAKGELKFKALSNSVAETIISRKL
ncbi:MAG: nucleotidyltransferase family protein [Thermoplasmatales archaeon]|nr:nucleotidyltransferase family protein [Thermoplasmatales archaeon]MCW6170933.1 nucleotidyltransferase family protein [Thermoplasmatales archaeon]